ncbi:hypothetical protein AAU61_07310 [Desulfocarbo indianensis]|nr:hypothetical protein AAU61_07310 [Desulfocarbo indianensis]
MADGTLILLQKEDSTLNPGLGQALGQGGGQRLMTREASPLPQVAFGPHGLVIWDVSNFSETEMNALAGELASESVGVLLAGAKESPLLGEALRRTNPLGLLIPGQPAPALGAAIAMAWAHHRRFHQLRGELERYCQELSDRLVVEKAKNLLMEHQGYTEVEAMRRLQRYSRNTNQKLAKVAQQLIAGYEVFTEDDFPA